MGSGCLFSTMLLWQMNQAGVVRALFPLMKEQIPVLCLSSEHTYNNTTFEGFQVMK